MSSAPPRPTQPPPRRGSWFGVLLAGAVGLFFLVGLLFLTLGYFGPVVLLAAGIFAFALLHYLVWGWWLARAVRDEAAEDDDEGPFWQVRRPD